MSSLFHLTFASIVMLFRTSNIVFSQESGPSNFFYQQPEYPRDCKEVQDSCSNQVSSGVFQIKPDGYHKPFEVYCDNKTDDGGWTVIQRRHDGSVTFQRDWLEYEAGFGFLSQEFWLGNKKLSFLTNQNTYELRIDFTYSYNSSSYGVYTLFRISDEFSGYTLTHLGLFSGIANFTACPSNEEYLPCTCEKSCGNPDVCRVTCTEEETCICPDGFYLNENDDCLPQEKCGCFMNGNIIPEGGSYVATDCSRQCNCSNGQLVCDEDIQCSSNAVCEERNGLRKCYCNQGYAGNGVTCSSVIITATDCLDVFNNGNTDSGIYNIKPAGWSGSPFEVYCNMTDGGGWTVFQRRTDGVTDFYRNWASYRNGFGTFDGDFWLGNEKLHYLTIQKNYKLRIELVTSGGTAKYALYESFRVGSNDNKYRVDNIGSYSGTTGLADGMRATNGRAFSTYDQDNDECGNHNCAQGHRGACWYANNWCSSCKGSNRDNFRDSDSCSGECTYSNLNGDYNGGNGEIIFWHDAYMWSPTFTEMKIRPS